MKTYYINVKYREYLSLTISKTQDWSEAERWVMILEDLGSYDSVWIADEPRNIRRH